ncbi:uncharacterized protein RCC_07499 [Ramularia collo-cygni]|uniref:SnoaL-like domain-containing protein n=1 Tax=Ramularia collo-cygni TaxID=112498 RepID=A0A2D3VFH8_9PEZI|nr:uncharacterized protein RCC_07499 [Ramularia collo-cygni]CZT21634.1 uncharacterized protein RCC_07499 [Ramularia collo-cygni]
MSLDDSTRPRLQSLADGFMQAINQQDFDRSSPAWQFLAPQFQGGPFPPVIKTKIGVEEWLEYLSDVRSSNPEWEIHILDSDAIPGPSKNFASLYINVEVHGLPVGVTWQSVGVYDFQCFDGEWLAISYRGFSGGQVGTF